VSHATIRSVLLAVLIVGAIGSVGMGTTYSLFTNNHDGTGTVSAADKINGNNGNGNGNGGGNGGTTADAGGTYTVTEDGTVELDGSGSTTSTGTIKEYEWEIVTNATDASDDSLSPTRGAKNDERMDYNAPRDVSEDTIAEVQLTVTDNKGNEDTDTATVTVSDSNG